MRKEAVDYIEFDFRLRFALQLLLEDIVAIKVDGENLLEGLGHLDLTDDVAVGALGVELSKLPEAIDDVSAGKRKRPGQLFAGFLEQGFLFFLEGLYDIGVSHQFVGGRFWIAVSGSPGGSDKVAGPGGNEAQLHVREAPELHLA